MHLQDDKGPALSKLLGLDVTEGGSQIINYKAKFTGTSPKRVNIQNDLG